MKSSNIKSAIILPLKENFTFKNFGAVSIWVNDYIRQSKNNNDLIFCRKNPNNKTYLRKNVKPISISGKFFTNLKYIKKISLEITKKKINIVEIHNRPEYVFYLVKNNPDVKINLIFHNDPNTIRYSDNPKNKQFLLTNCKKIIFVSKWLKQRFFYNLDNIHNNNTKIIYNFINPIKSFPKKQKIIIFSGKLNKSKGYEIFGEAIIKILDKFPDWNALVYGNEQREVYKFNHKRLRINNWISHKELLKVYEKSSISVVNPTWEEPFGRTSMESASRGCAVITSNSGGLSETFHNNLILQKNNPSQLFNLISRLIKDKKYLLNIQKSNFKNIIHTPHKTISALNSLRSSQKIYKTNINKFYKILHISNFDVRTSHRLFNLSIAKKISNGLIRNGHDVINFDYRNYKNKFLDLKSLNKKIIEITNNYRPNLILLGHNNSLSRETITKIKTKYDTKFALWFEDHVIKGDPNFRKNLDLIELNHDIIDQYFITTAPEIIKTKIPFSKINFLPIPVDPNIESGHFYEISKSKDLFFALSNGVNFGKLKKNIIDERLKFIEKLILSSEHRINFNILGLYNEQPKWNYAFNNELMISKTALNLSRGGPSKYASSNRIASIMGNGVLPFIDEKIKYQDFFDNDEIETYTSPKNLILKLSNIIHHEKKLIVRSKNAKRRYFDLFNNRIIADFIVHKVFDIKNSFKFIWEK
jgi:glycosyltransferase involved in cell wall biosynthesis